MPFSIIKIKKNNKDHALSKYYSLKRNEKGVVICLTILCEFEKKKACFVTVRFFGCNHIGNNVGNGRISYVDSATH